ncbi:MAG: DUF4129 domain-containing protein [Nesterenkonia sp.]
MYDRDEARRLLEEELSGTEYQRQFSGPVREAIDRFLQWLQEGALNLGVVDIPAGPLVVLFLLAAAITVVLLVVRPRLQRSAAADRGVDIERGITAAELRARADRSAEAGNYDDAARDRFRALVRAAEERSLLRSSTGRTATEITEQLAIRFGEHGERLRAAADLFNLSRYGRQRLSVQQYEQLRALDATLREADPTEGADAAGPRLVVPQ